MAHAFPRLHNAMWPGLVGKGEGSEPPIALDDMIAMTAAACVGEARFQGIDIFAAAPHTAIDADRDTLARLAEQVQRHDLVIGSIVAPVWPPVGGGAAMGDAAARGRFLEMVRKTCAMGRTLRDLGVRSYGVIRIDSASAVADWAADPGASATIAATFREACDIAADHGERLAAEGEICWGGMHGWRHMLQLLEAVGGPDRLGFQADMAHTLLYVLGHNAPEDRIVPDGFAWDRAELDAALRTMADALRPWTIDVHIAQNDGTVFGSGSHDKTGRHCLPDDPDGKLDLVRDSAVWLRGGDGAPTRAVQHVCWDGCMFPNAVMRRPETWTAVLAAMVAVRDAHGWDA